MTIRHQGSLLTWQLLAPADVKIRLAPPDVATRAGFARLAFADLPPGSREATWKITLSSDAPPRD
jgi:hypothetical protein